MIICFMYLAIVGFANSRATEDTKQVLSSFMYVFRNLLIKNISWCQNNKYTIFIYDSEKNERL